MSGESSVPTGQAATPGLARVQPRPWAQTLVVVLAAPKKDVASLLGTTPEAFSRGLRRLADDGLIAIEGPRVTLLDPEALEALAAE